ncbi:MAG: tRNA uridine-5-carboxymethylaminomethyl(34) synthesis GTPase MnmE [Candidatus Firestonebacteria bacterium RIFOXYA2_FULL_40_8]|nr:MAG: tRNA uridine-5-carboxymethylaminomethyl(34) synthesis GTPase MnmE [Candidatus Firestonebacteria bacterium RIFOXYA2_FULL_40_8]
MKDTIAAISTPPGESGLGIVRVSGPKAVSIVSKIFKPKKEKVLAEMPSYSAHYGFIVNPVNREVLDEVIVTVMKAPATYTREDVTEINCHGGLISVRRTLELLLKNGARLAEPGEFTKRAFLNGRIDLAQAEAVFDVIKAKTEESLKAAVKQLKGGLSEKMNEIALELKNTCASVEANIEFAEEELETTGMPGVKKELQKILKKINSLLATAEGGIILREGIKTAIIGKPNAGKSSLLNELLDEERAIVTHIPGTTRDVIEETINIEGIAFVLSDTAGIREAKDLVERKGIERSIIAIDEADLLLAVFDGATDIEKEDLEIINKIKGKNIIAVINKTDLKPAKTTENELKKLLNTAVFVKISLLKKSGMEKLKKEMGKVALEKGARSKESLIITNVRHKELLLSASGSIKHALESIDKKMSEEFIALDIRGALDYIGSITGRVSTDDILNKIFSDFCIGK